MCPASPLSPRPARVETPFSRSSKIFKIACFRYVRGAKIVRQEGKAVGAIRRAIEAKQHDPKDSRNIKCNSHKPNQTHRLIPLSGPNSLAGRNGMLAPIAGYAYQPVQPIAS